MNMQLCLLSLVLLTSVVSAQLKEHTVGAFHKYVNATEAAMRQREARGSYLVLGQKRNTDVEVREFPTRLNGKEIEIPDGLVHHWLGHMFLPGVKLEQVRAAMLDYDNYKNYYKPDVIDSKLMSRDGDRVEVFLRLYKHQFLTVVYNSTYDIQYRPLPPNRLSIDSRSKRIRELKDPHNPSAGEKEPGDEHGFLWRLNSYWRFEESQDGVFVECEAVSLSRDVPYLVGRMIGSFLKRFPRESMESTMSNLKKSIAEGAGAKPGD